MFEGIKKLLMLPVNLFKGTRNFRRPLIDVLDYDAYWKARSEETAISQTDIDIAKEIKVNSTVCDLGCGNCHLLDYLSKEKNARVLGYDISSEALSVCRKKGVMAVKGDLTKPSFKLEQVYDYILICDVIEHLPVPELLLRNIKNNFKKKLIVTVPNVAYFTNRVRLLFGRFPLAWAIHPFEHLRYWSIIDFKHWVKDVLKDYEIEKIIPDRGVMYLRDMIPNLFATGIIVVLKRSKK